MDISAIIYAGIGGGGGAALGVFLFWFIQKMRGENPDSKTGSASGVRGGLVGGLAVAGGLLMGRLYDNMVLPRIVPMDDSGVLKDLPVMAVIKEQNPEAYAKILYPADRADRNGNVTQKDLDELRATYFKLIEEKTKVANGSTLKSLVEISKYQNQILREKQPRVCTLIMNGEPFPALEQYFTEEEKNAEQKVMVKLFTEEPRSSQFVPDLQRGKALFETALLKPMKEMGISNLRPDPSENAGNEEAHRKICDLAVAYTENQQSLSDEDIINLTEYLRSL